MDFLFYFSPKVFHVDVSRREGVSAIDAISPSLGSMECRSVRYPMRMARRPTFPDASLPHRILPTCFPFGGPQPPRAFLPQCRGIG